VKIGELGEFGLISRIASGVADGRGVITGIGDDAAVTALSPGMQLLTSTDMLVEEVHFRRSWHDPYRLGRKSLAASISDIAAMGGIPRWALLSLAVPHDISLEFLDAFICGFLALADEQGVALIGGDTCSSRYGLTISVTIMGEQEAERVVRRSGACPGDDIWVTGTVGDAALGLELLEKGEIHPSLTAEERGYLISRLLDPSPRAAAGRALAEAGLVSAMIDVSDGLLADFGHIAEQSAFGGTIRLDSIPLSPAFCAAFPSPPPSCHDLALAGGEDYELAFTAPAANREKIVRLMKRCGIDAAPVGIVTALPEVTAVLADGSRYVPRNKGFNHFS
jgi:thiamine-monophosphate kinase